MSLADQIDFAIAEQAQEAALAMHDFAAIQHRMALYLAETVDCKPSHAHKWVERTVSGLTGSIAEKMGVGQFSPQLRLGLLEIVEQQVVGELVDACRRGKQEARLEFRSAG